MQIRKSKLSDQDEIADLIKDTIKHVNVSDYSSSQLIVWSNKIHQKMLKERFKSVIQYVATENNRIIGMGDINIQEQELDFLYIHKNFVGNGVGSKILSQLEVTAKENGISILKVTASVTAKYFFEKRGFKVVKKKQKDVDDTKFDVFLMSKDLDTNS